MASGNKLNEALQMILDNLNETNCADAEIELIEAENAQLRQKKVELMEKLNRHSTVSSSLVLVKDMLSRQQTINQARYESKEHAAVRFRFRSQEAAAQIACWKQKLQEVNNFMTLPHNEVLQKILEMDGRIADNRSKINELIQVHEKLSANRKKEAEDTLKLNETLKCVEEEQRELLEKLEEETVENKHLQGCEEA